MVRHEMVQHNAGLAPMWMSSGPARSLAAALQEIRVRGSDRRVAAGVARLRELAPTLPGASRDAEVRAEQWVGVARASCTDSNFNDAVPRSSDKRE